MSADFSSRIQRLQHGLVVSCQAPIDSPLHDPPTIAAMARAAVNQGAVGVRVDTPAHVSAVRQHLTAPIIGLWKQTIAGFDVYITPQFQHAEAIAHAGADIIAIDATLRDRPQNETVAALIAQIHTNLNKPVMADVDTLEAAIAAAAAGADLIGTTLYGYTDATPQSPPNFDLLAQMVQAIDVPIICEGGIASPLMARTAFDYGAYAVVVGTAITGIDSHVKAYSAAIQARAMAGTVLAKGEASRYCFTLCDPAAPSYRNYINARMDETYVSHRDVGQFFTVAARQTRKPLEILLLDESLTIVGGLIASTSGWEWLVIDLLWVHDAHRDRGYGTRLMALAEQEARHRGCKHATLSTLSFQARGFYEKLGYTVVGQLDDFPPGQTKYWLKKSLV